MCIRTSKRISPYFEPVHRFFTSPSAMSIGENLVACLMLQPLMIPGLANRLVVAGRGVRSFSSSSRPNLITLLPNKKTVNRLLFDHDSRLAYKKSLEILNSVYSNIDDPTLIKLPSYTTSDDLMLFKQVLSTIRTTTNAINRHLLDLENELVEQAAELGNNDAIAILAFKAVEDKSTSTADYKHANELIKELTAIKHPLVFKLAGDLAFKRNLFVQAEDYWLKFLELEPNTILSSHVCSNLGIYYFNYVKPKPDLQKAKWYLQKSIKYGELDTYTIKSHYYLGQMFSINDPVLSKYHLEVSASRGLKESFPTLGFLEMNVFKNFTKSLEWFKLGVESNNDLSCLIGQFDCYTFMKDTKQASVILIKLMEMNEKLNKLKPDKVPRVFVETFENNKYLLRIFFTSRKNIIDGLQIA